MEFKDNNHMAANAYFKNKNNGDEVKYFVGSRNEAGPTEGTLVGFDEEAGQVTIKQEEESVTLSVETLLVPGAPDYNLE